MSKMRSLVFPVAVCTGLLVVSFFVSSFVTAVNLLAQEAPPQTGEQRQAREALNKGVQDYKNGQYEEAIEDFRHAKQLDPQLVNARLYLATAYASLYIPGAPSGENRQKGEASITEFRDVLSIWPENLTAIDGVGSLLFQMAGQPYNSAMFLESKSYHLKHAQLRPGDPEPYYWIGVIDWTLSFRANGEMRAKYNETNINRQIRDTDPLPALLREEYRSTYGPVIDEGVEALKHAIQLRLDYDDAMAYLNLLYRRKADTVAARNERAQLMKMADDLVDKIMEIKKRKAEAPSQP